MTIAACVLGCPILLASLGWFGWCRYSGPGPLAHTRDVVVPHGAPSLVAELLQHNGIVVSTLAFRAAALATRGSGPLHAAEFAFPDHASLRDVLAILRTARPVQHRLTIPEGLTAAQIALLLDGNGELDGPTPVPAEGSVLPESYAFEHGFTRTALLDRATTAMQRSLSAIWAGRSEDLPLAAPEDLVTLASIVERETGRPEERAHIAGVFLNRLRLGMRLQSDPTVAYAASGGMGTAERGLTRAELDHPSPYNTYRSPGLPPGPIDSPGIAALQAVAHPMATQDLYFVADGSGGHAFAATLEAHNRNVAQWRALQAAIPGAD